MKLHDISWDAYEGLISSLDKELRTREPEGTICLFGIPRGGALVALHLSYLSDRYRIVSFSEMVEDIGSSQCVVVDDILETGKARQEMCEYLDDETPYFAVLIDKSAVGNTTPADFSVEQMDDATWIKFPYEKLDLEKEKVSQKERGYDREEG